MQENGVCKDRPAAGRLGPGDHRGADRRWAQALRGRRSGLGRRHGLSHGLEGQEQPEPTTVTVTETTARALQETEPGHADSVVPVFELTGEILKWLS